MFFFSLVCIDILSKKCFILFILTSLTLQIVQNSSNNGKRVKKVGPLQSVSLRVNFSRCF